ncbi:MAG: GNAT family N-acetyltransferase [Hyphomicrobiales bacterium]
MAGPSVALEEELSEADRRRVLDGLIAFNTAKAGPLDHRELFVSLREQGELRGACVGRTYWNWLYVDMLWIAEGFRDRGYGKTLLSSAEEEARGRGCRNVYLDTFSFQAPEFYRKLGYEEFGRLPDFPDGHARFFLTKEL